MTRRALQSRGGRLFVVCAALFLSFSFLYFSHVQSASAKEPPPGSPKGATRTTVVTATPDPYEVDDTSDAATVITSGVPQTHSIYSTTDLVEPGSDEDWVKFTLDSPHAVTIETMATDPSDTTLFDTELKLFDSGMNLMDYNDDKQAGTQYSYIQRCALDILPAGTYYVRVNEFGHDDVIPTYNIAYTINGGCRPKLNVTIGGAWQSNTYLLSGQSARLDYPGLSNGPVKVTDLDGATKIIASERVAYTPDGGATWSGFSEVMGLPSNQLTTAYVMPWYNNVDLNTQVRFGNVGNTSTNVTVSIGGVVQGTYPVAPSQSLRISYPGVNNGPVVISSSGNVPIIASERVAYSPDGGTTWPHFAELMGLPANRLTTTYVMPWYNNLELNTQLRFGNVGSQTTTVTVWVGGVAQGSYVLGPSQSTRVSYAGLNNGPVVVISSNNVPIIASERVAYTSDGGTTWPSFTELMGLPAGSLGNNYWLPIYDNVSYNDQLRFGNVGTASTTVTVTVAGTLQGIYTVPPSQSLRVSYPGLNAGPVHVTSSGNVPIIVSHRVAYTPDSGVSWSNFAEMMALPASQLTISYVMPWYNNYELNTQVRIAVP